MAPVRAARPTRRVLQITRHVNKKTLRSWIKIDLPIFYLAVPFDSFSKSEFSKLAQNSNIRFCNVFVDSNKGTIGVRGPGSELEKKNCYCYFGLDCRHKTLTTLAALAVTSRSFGRENTAASTATITARENRARSLRHSAVIDLRISSVIRRSLYERLGCEHPTARKE